jgi:hypothetical protein
MGMPIVSRKWNKDKKELDRVFAGITVRKWPTCEGEGLCKVLKPVCTMKKSITSNASTTQFFMYNLSIPYSHCQVLLTVAAVAHDTGTV